MKKALMVTLSCSLIGGILGLLLVGCLYQNQEAKKPIKKAQVHIDQSNKLQKELDEKWRKIGNLPETPGGYRERLRTSVEIESKLKTQMSETKKAIDQLEQAKALRVSGELNDYLGLRIDAQEASLQYYKATLEVAKLAIDMYQKIVDGAELGKVQAQTNYDALQLVSRAKDLQKEADLLKAKADRYYKEHNLAN